MHPVAKGIGVRPMPRPTVPCFADVLTIAPASRREDGDTCDADDAVWDALQEFETKAASDAPRETLQQRAIPSVLQRLSQEHGNRLEEAVPVKPVVQVVESDDDDDDFEPSPPTPPSLLKLRKVVPDIRRIAAGRSNCTGEGERSSARKKRLKKTPNLYMDAMSACDAPVPSCGNDVMLQAQKHTCSNGFSTLQSKSRPCSASQSTFPSMLSKSTYWSTIGRPVGRTLPFAYERDPEEQQQRKISREDALFPLTPVDVERVHNVSISPSSSLGRPPQGKSAASADMDIRPSQVQDMGKAPRKRLWSSLFNDEDDGEEEEVLAELGVEKSRDVAIQDKGYRPEMRDQIAVAHEAHVPLCPPSHHVSGSEIAPFRHEEKSVATPKSARNRRPRNVFRTIENASKGSTRTYPANGLVENKVLNHSTKLQDARLFWPDSVAFSLDSSQDKESSAIDDASNLPLPRALQRNKSISSNHCAPGSEIASKLNPFSTPSRRRLSMTLCSPRTSGAKYLGDHGTGLDQTSANSDSESEPVAEYSVTRHPARKQDDLGDPHEVLLVRKAPRVSPVCLNSNMTAAAATDSEWLHERSIQNFSDSDTEIQPRFVSQVRNSTTNRGTCGNAADVSLRRDLFPNERSPGFQSVAEGSMIGKGQKSVTAANSHPDRCHLICLSDESSGGEKIPRSTDENSLEDDLAPPPYNVKAILCNPGENMESMLDRLGEEYVIDEIFKAREAGRRIVGAEALGFSDDLNVPKTSTNSMLIRKFKDSLGREKKHYDIEAATATLAGAKEKFAQKYSRMRGNGKSFRGKRRAVRKGGFRGRSRR